MPTTKRIVMIRSFANERECLRTFPDQRAVEVETALADELLTAGHARLAESPSEQPAHEMPPTKARRRNHQ